MISLPRAGIASLSIVSCGRASHASLSSYGKVFQYVLQQDEEKIREKGDTVDLGQVRMMSCSRRDSTVPITAMKRCIGLICVDVHDSARVAI
jgi:hypothetical protein